MKQQYIRTKKGNEKRLNKENDHDATHLITRSNESEAGGLRIVVAEK